MADKTTRTPHRDSATRDQHGKEAHITAKNTTADDAHFMEQFAGQLSPSTLRARWIHTTAEHEEHPGQTLATRSHEIIQRWAEERGGTPATVSSTAHGDRDGVLRFDFPGYGGEKLEQIGWDEWFRSFDQRNLVFIYQEHKSSGEQSNFFRLDSPQREDA